MLLWGSGLRSPLHTYMALPEKLETSSVGVWCKQRPGYWEGGAHKSWALFGENAQCGPGLAITALWS